MQHKSDTTEKKLTGKSDINMFCITPYSRLDLSTELGRSYSNNMLGQQLGGKRHMAIAYHGLLTSYFKCLLQ